MSFVRNLRHSFILKGDYKKHVVFMLFEILLITIGISIALQFDDWENAKKDTKVRTQYLIDLKKELEADVDFFRKLIPGQKRTELVTREVYRVLKENDLEVDMLQFINDLASITRWSAWGRKPIIWRELQFSGKLDLISNRELVSDLQYYYDDLDTHYSNELLEFVDKTNDMRNLLFELFALEDMDDYFETYPWNQDKPADDEIIKRIFNHPDLEKMIKNYIVWLKIVSMNIEYFTERTERLILSVEKELNKEK